MMYEKGEFIIYGTTGVCQVEDITTLDMNGAERNRLYYVLSPYYQKGSRVFTPTDNKKAIMRRILTKQEALSLIDEIPDIEVFWIENDKLREEKYKTAVRSGECREWISVIKTLYLRQQERVSQGKKITSTDGKYFKMAEDYLYSELAVALSISKDETERYIEDRITLSE